MYYLYTVYESIINWLSILYILSVFGFLRSPLYPRKFNANYTCKYLSISRSRVTFKSLLLILDTYNYTISYKSVIVLHIV